MNTLNALIASFILSAPPIPLPGQPPAYVAQRPPMPQQQWKQSIIAEAQRYCEAYPRDGICNFQDSPSR